MTAFQGRLVPYRPDVPASSPRAAKFLAHLANPAGYSGTPDRTSWWLWVHSVLEELRAAGLTDAANRLASDAATYGAATYWREDPDAAWLLAVVFAEKHRPPRPIEGQPTAEDRRTITATAWWSYASARLKDGDWSASLVSSLQNLAKRLRGDHEAAPALLQALSRARAGAEDALRRDRSRPVGAPCEEESALRWSRERAPRSPTLTTSALCLSSIEEEIAATLAAIGHADEAQELYQQVATSRRELLGEGHHDTLRIDAVLGRADPAVSAYDADPDAALAAALAAETISLAPSDDVEADALRLADGLAATGRIEESLTFYHAAIGRLDDTYRTLFDRRPEHGETQEYQDIVELRKAVAWRYIDLLESAGRDVEAFFARHYFFNF